MWIAFLKKYAKSILNKEVCEEGLASHEMYAFHPLKNCMEAVKMPEMHVKRAESTPIEQAIETVLSEGAFVKGELKFHKVIRINGSFEGAFCAQGKLIIGPKGFVRAHIHLDEAVIQGKVVGSISVKKLTLLSSAEIVGNIKAESISIDVGAKISGHISVGMHESKEDATISLSQEFELEAELQVSC